MDVTTFVGRFLDVKFVVKLDHAVKFPLLIALMRVSGVVLNRAPDTYWARSVLFYSSRIILFTMGLVASFLTKDDGELEVMGSV